MDASSRLMLADLILAIHLGVIAFNVFGLVVIPLGAWRRWPFVRVFWWRALHLASLAVVALQALLGRVCFLTIWQAELAAPGHAGLPAPLIARWVNGLIFWPLPLWVFALLYVAVCVIALLLWRLMPPRRRRRSSRGFG
jgi:Protein of Unknown function (DUF2784)